MGPHIVLYMGCTGIYIISGFGENFASKPAYIFIYMAVPPCKDVGVCWFTDLGNMCAARETRGCELDTVSKIFENDSILNKIRLIHSSPSCTFCAYRAENP